MLITASDETRENKEFTNRSRKSCSDENPKRIIESDIKRPTVSGTAQRKDGRTSNENALMNLRKFTARTKLKRNKIKDNESKKQSCN